MDGVEGGMAERVSVLDSLRRRARALKVETLALYHVARDPRVPWYARLFVGIVVAYALSPIDLIPDFVPILGYLDDLILLPLGIALVIKLIPPGVMAECRVKAGEMSSGRRPRSIAAAVVIVLVWIALAILGLRLAVALLDRIGWLPG